MNSEPPERQLIYVYKVTLGVLDMIGIHRYFLYGAIWGAVLFIDYNVREGWVIDLFWTPYYRIVIPYISILLMHITLMAAVSIPLCSMILNSPLGKRVQRIQKRRKEQDSDGQ